VKGLICRRLYETVSRPSPPPPHVSVRVLNRAKAKWRNATRLESREVQAARREKLSTPEQRAHASSEAARDKWKRVGEIARRAGADDPKDASDSENEDEAAPEQCTEQRRKKSDDKSAREKTAKMMDLQYFLEMVDQKHRYGSNLRAYHEQWKKAETHENFFYWLDYGEGKNFEHSTVSRERLEKEQVRYLSREERLSYLVTIDKEGRLCWAKNGERINTTPEYKDSVNGIVPVDDDTPAFGPNGKILFDGQSKVFNRGSRCSSLSSSSSDSSLEHSDVEGEHYVNEDLDKAKGLSKLKHVSAATVLNHLLRSSVKPNSWIFVSHPPAFPQLRTDSTEGCRHVVSSIHWHQAVWCFPAQLLPAWCSNLCCRSNSNQGWTAASTLSSIRPLPTAYQELSSLCALYAG
jgi:hypothetical protein